MALTPAPFCPQCGASLQGSKRFCTNCGATIEIDASSPTIAASQTPAPPPPYGTRPGPRSVDPNTETVPNSTPPNRTFGGPSYGNSNESFLPPPPPPPVYNPYTDSVPGRAQNYVPTPPPLTTPSPLAGAGAYPVPDYARKPKGKRGCVTASVILLLVLAAGVGGYFLVNSFILSKLGKSNAPATSSTSNSGTTPGAGQGSTPTVQTNAASTEQLNLQVTYASVNITLVSAQLARNFSDDTSTTAGSAGIVRINLRENNPTSSNPDYIEGDSMLLLLPGGASAQPGNAQTAVSPAAGVNRQNWLDFALNSPVALTQLTLRIGRQSENQMDIPLQPKADISKYLDKTSNPNAQFKYGPLDMTLKTATLSYSYNDTQATTGNRYVIITLAAANSTTSGIYLEPSSYMRLQAGGNSIQPDSTTTLPVEVAANASSSGVVAFLVPQATTTFTLVLLAQPTNSPPISQVTQNFQIS